MARPALRIAILTAALAVAFPAAASAQDPAPPPAPAPPAPPAPAPPAPPPQQPGKARLQVKRLRSGPVLPGDSVRVRVVVQPYVGFQEVAVRVLRGGKRRAELKAPVVPGPGGRGIATVTYRATGAGRFAVRAVHAATPLQAAFRAGPRHVTVRALEARLGDRGRPVRILQRALVARHYVVGRRGRYDDRTARAVTTFRKVVGLRRTDVATPDLFRRLARGQGAFRVRFPGHGKHVEADLSRQVLALVRGGRVQRIYPTSSGAPATPTVLGHFRVYLKTPGTNAKGMVDSNYFIRGYAIHGYASVPVFNASHGCLRVPVPDAASINRWLKLGDRVDVYP
jgi:hypothetical protein